MKFVKNACLAACTALALAGALVAHADSIISVHFEGSNTQGNYSGIGPTGGANNGPLVTGVAGAIPVGNFNNAPGYNSSVPSLVEDNSGTASVTSASVSYSGANVYNAYQGTPPTSTQDYIMMGGYLDSQPGQNISITVSGLGSEFTSSGYKVLIYRNTDSSGVTGYNVVDSNLVSKDGYLQMLSSTQGGNYPLSPNYVGSTASTPAGTGSTASNYVTISGFTGSSFTITGINPNFSGDGRPRINGFQIVALPEPASVGLLGLGAISLLSRRRRD